MLNGYCAWPILQLARPTAVSLVRQAGSSPGIPGWDTWAGWPGGQPTDTAGLSPARAPVPGGGPEGAFRCRALGEEQPTGGSKITVSVLAMLAELAEPVRMLAGVTHHQPQATASAGTTFPERRWWLSSTGSRAATTSTSFRPRSSAISTECSTSYIARLPRFRKPFKKEKERYSKRSRGKQQRRPSPEDRVVLENGERQGERGHPPGWALAPQQARSHWKWRQSPRGRGDQPPGWALVPPPQRACSR